MSDTVASLLAQGSQALDVAGVASACRDVSVLLAHVLDGDPAGLRAEPERAVKGAVIAQFRDLIERRCAREPVSHLIGSRDFWRHSFRVTPDVLDPRPETETLVEVALSHPGRRVLDLGTGSGCILLSVLADRPEARGVGTDIAPAALELACENAERIGIAERATFLTSDWFDAVDGRFDLILSNPPYIARDEMAGLEPELSYEPRGALTDEGDGLSAYRAIAAAAPGHLASGGRLIVEVGHSQARAVGEIFRKAGLEDVAVHCDLDGRERVVSAGAN